MAGSPPSPDITDGSQDWTVRAQRLIRARRYAAGAFLTAVAGGLAVGALFPTRPLILTSSHIVPALGLLAAGVLAACLLAGPAIGPWRRQIRGPDHSRQAEEVSNRRLHGIASILEAIGSVRDLDRVLETAVAEVASALPAKGSSVKLLSEDGKFLRYAAAVGLPERIAREKVVEVERSPLNKRIIDGEPFVTAELCAREMFQFGESLSEAHIQSVLFVPLRLEGRVVGILGAYGGKPDRFEAEEVRFLRLAAGLVTVALGNDRACETLTALSHEHIRLMTKVADNLRAPLADMVDILRAAGDGCPGPGHADPSESLRRIDRSARILLALINELMVLFRSRRHGDADPAAATDAGMLARRIQLTFQDIAAARRVELKMTVAPDLPPIRGRLENVEQVLENLVSNAIKYTPPEGSVDVRIAPANGTVRIEVCDTGIGIPAADRSKLFTEFFRAGNAWAMEAVGSGLGLAVVKAIVDRLGGRILVESEEGVGSIFAVHLPVAPAASV